MTREELKEKAALEAYPENVSYSTLVEKNVDYNGRDRIIYKQGYGKGFEDVLDKACEWLEKNACNYEYSEGTCDSWFSASDLVESFRKYMEEQ